MPDTPTNAKAFGRHTSAASDLNRIHLTGTLGSEPVLYTIGDHPVADLALACHRRWPTANGADEVETTWIDLRAREGAAEQCGRLLHSGDRVYVEGSLHLWNTRSATQSHPCHSRTTRAPTCHQGTQTRRVQSFMAGELAQHSIQSERHHHQSTRSGCVRD